MATKPTSLRLTPATIRTLDYLATIAHTSQAGVITDLLSAWAQALQQEAFGLEPQAGTDPTLLKNGGTIITVEEQKAWTILHNRLAGAK
ncbi:MAG: hypothetical protein M1294_01070 [Firmicutes bacterium]|jgi:hypothetical protein|uniref:Uncharacterized protein n=1 Tax=Sulfobacillus benefaciens TaxID=453960 RepID=A0A2T2WF77_9FIRM|nr:hypothetical protein [Bacillota bacterium]MCL5012712.1 hypothetical protein [Bacillota bacterium]PSR20897.1 MAG: hypothetical protein C7B43_21645 [Sulfobacillus benefaciens]